MIACLAGFLLPATAQSSLSEYEDTLVTVAREIQSSGEDFVRLNASGRFYSLMMMALEEEGAYDYPFDSLVSISKLSSEDGRLRVFTWVIAKNDGSYDFGGILMSKPEKGKEYKVYKLEDHSSEIQNPEIQVLTQDHWYGALYYKLIEKSYNGHTLYTLLGWDGNNALSRKKLVETVTLSPSGKPVFGASVFARFPRKCKRVIFEYNANTTMTLNYSTQLMDVKHKKGKKKVIRKEAGEMIVFDRLAPMNSSVEGVFQFYYPETNILDGFVFDNGRWNYIREVDARNESGVRSRVNRKPEMDLFPQKEGEKK